MQCILYKIYFWKVFQMYYNLICILYALLCGQKFYSCKKWVLHYRNQHVKTKGPMTKREHSTFLIFWLELFIFCGPSLAPTKNYLSLAYELAKCATVGLGKLFLG
jgi:hypothetical protein